MKQQTLSLQTTHRGLINITDAVNKLVKASDIKTGLCHVFLHHTSASLILCENADPDVLYDMENFMQRLVPDGDVLYQHTDEGPDDMPAHVRTVLTQSFLIIPVTHGKLALGTWQGIFLWEHRLQSHTRQMTVSIF